MSISLLTVLDYAGVALFAASGALRAAELRQDIVTFLFFAAVTGVGGGTLRDLLIDAPVFWVIDPGYSIACAAAGVLVWITRARPLPGRALLWLDAAGLCIYAAVGAGKALALGVSPPICVVMGVLTATFGGVLRDVLAGQPSVLLQRELYVTPAIASATVFVAVMALEAGPLWASAAAVAVGFTLRAGAILAGWRLPAFRPPGDPGARA
jgi:uncharacterized membrane protein YeiH